jgi:hypothetical protein
LFNLFLKLDFSQGTIFKFQNNVGSTYEDVLKLFDFYERNLPPFYLFKIKTWEKQFFNLLRKFTTCYILAI